MGKKDKNMQRANELECKTCQAAGRGRVAWCVLRNVCCVTWAVWRETCKKNKDESSIHLPPLFVNSPRIIKKRQPRTLPHKKNQPRLILKKNQTLKIKASWCQQYVKRDRGQERIEREGTAAMTHTDCINDTYWLYTTREHVKEKTEIDCNAVK